MNNIVITGSIAYDYVMTFPGRFSEHILLDSLEKLNLSFHVHDMTRHWGGTGANIAYTLALLGERPHLLASAGKDFGEYRRWLDQAGVDTSTVRQYDDIFTASFFVNTDQANCQIASFYGGAMDRAHELTLEEAVNGQADLVTISPNHTPAMTGYVSECKRLGIPYVFDPGQQIIRMNEDELRDGVSGAKLLTVNDYEYEMLRNKTGLSANDITAATETVIITRGEEGADILSEGRKTHIPSAPPRQVADPTGAGDGFRSGLLKGLAAGWSLELAGRIGALAGTYVVEERGPQTHRFTPEEFVSRFREAFADFDDEGALDAMLPAAGDS